MNAAGMLLGGDDDAIALLQDEARITYGDLRRRVRRAAAAWSGQGLRPGSRCILAVPDGIDWVEAFLGLIWLGAQPIAVSPRTDAGQLRDLMEDSAAATLLLQDEAAAAFGDVRAVGLGAWRVQQAEAQELAQAHEAGSEDPAFWLYSSGTTGKPKGIRHAQRCVAHAHLFARDVLGATSGDVFYSTSKLFFAYPLANALFAGLRMGASVVLDSEWPTPERVAFNMARYRPTLFFSVPTLYRRLLDSGQCFASLRRAVSAGEACPPDVAEAWRVATGVPLVNGYGTTETLALMLYRTAQMGSLQPTPLTRVRAEAASGDRDGAVSLWFDHPSVALGYSRPVTHDSARFGKPGFSPGDLFRAADAAGWSFAGRSDQLLKVFGRWVDVPALEQVLAQRLRGQVGESCIVPSGRAGEDTVALHLFAVPEGRDEAAVRRSIEIALADLPAYQRPQAIHLVADLPRTETGKLRRGELGRIASAIAV